MPDYFHSALKGDQIHEAKIKVLPASSVIPAPEWQGQMLVVGLNFYVAVTQNNVLVWMQPQAFNRPELPSNVVTFELGYGNPQPKKSGSGVIYTNIQTQDNFYLNLGRWVKLGPVSDAQSLEIISAPSWEYINPGDGTMNRALLKNYETNKKYYFAFKAPPVNQIGGVGDDYLLMVNGATQTNLSPQENSQLLLELNTNNFNTAWEYILTISVNLSSGYKNNCNFSLDLNSRLIEVKNLATVNYGSY